MEDVVVDKTDKGRREIATREYRLSARLRALWLLVDGRKGSTELLDQAIKLGLGPEHLEQLRERGLICAAASSTADEPLLRALYAFHTDTIKRNIGLRGYALQLQSGKGRRRAHARAATRRAARPYRTGGLNLPDAYSMPWLLR
jgi:hypothetical protein